MYKYLFRLFICSFRFGYILTQYSHKWNSHALFRERARQNCWSADLCIPPPVDVFVFIWNLKQISLTVVPLRLIVLQEQSIPGPLWDPFVNRCSHLNHSNAVLHASKPQACLIHDQRALILQGCRWHRLVIRQPIRQQTDLHANLSVVFFWLTARMRRVVFAQWLC